MVAVLSPAEVLLAFCAAGGFFAVTALVIEVIVRTRR